MEIFWKAAAAVLLAAILGLVLDRQGKDFSVLLTIAVCTMIGAAALSYLEPVMQLLHELEGMGDVPFLETLLKAVGIGLTAELTGLICTDAGKASLGKVMQMLGGAVVLSRSVPIFRALLTMIRQMIGGL